MSVRDELRAHLRRAMRDRDRPAVRAIRTALGAIANAEAVDAPEHLESPLGSPGLSRDVPRRELGAGDVSEILRAEVRERRAALADYERHGRTEQADELRAELRVLAQYVGDIEPEQDSAWV
ncbi:MAG TPA: GatB/YqeY domain-containing protein [Streptosporangiales bacterium]